MGLQTKKSEEWYARAARSIPGGVNSPVRAFKSVGGNPPFIERGKGAHIYDIDGNSYIDYVGSWGPLILGHADAEMIADVEHALHRGASFGAPTCDEVILAEMVKEAFPHIEKLRCVSSGTEAAMSALRLARAATKRDGIVKFEGCYHGHADALLVAAGSGALTFGKPSSDGVPADVTRHTYVLPFNNVDALRQLLSAKGREIAGVIVEGVPGNMGVVPPSPEFLRALCELTKQCGALLICDEVMSGFRVAFGGAQELYGFKADITVLGKIIGGGLPVGAYGASAALMEHVSPEGGMYQAGTLSGNPLSMAAGMAMLRRLRGRVVYKELERLGAGLERGLAEVIAKRSARVRVQRVGSMITLFFTDRPVVDYASAMTCDTKAFARFHRAMLEHGVYLPASQFEAWFVSAAHGDREIEKTLHAAEAALLV